MRTPPFPALAIIAAALCAALTGCLPEERFWWSPDGTRALVWTEDELHLTNDAEPSLTPMAPDAWMKDATLRGLSWLPDGSGFVCERLRKIPAWNEVRSLIPAAEAEAIEKFGPAILPLLDAAAQIGNGTSGGENSIVTALAKDSRFIAALRRIAEQDPEGVKRRLRALAPESSDEKPLGDLGDPYEISELCLVRLKPDGNLDALPLPLARSLLTPTLMPRVSPRHAAVAFTSPIEDGEKMRLEVISLDGHKRVIVAHQVSAFDWTSDGKSLVFTASFDGGDCPLQVIHSLQVIEESGELREPSGREDSKDLLSLATAIMVDRPVVQSLADGRVLFASYAATLPAAGTGPDLEPSLFIVSANGKEVARVPTAPGALPSALGFFTASPDGKRVAVVESATDAVAVVEIDTGKTTIVSPAHANWHCRTMPAWKSSTELTFAALHGDPPVPNWMLWSTDGAIRCLSENWPATATAKWLERKESDAKSDTFPAESNPTR